MFESPVASKTKVNAPSVFGELGDKTMASLSVRLNVVGHASPRWKSARSASEAASRNQALSAARAENVRKAVEMILKQEIPNLPINVPAVGVGSSQKFPTASEDNAAIDRSVIVTVDLVTHDRRLSAGPPRKRRVYVPSKIWTMKVVSLGRMAGLGYVRIFLRISLENAWNKKSANFAGWVQGGGPAMSFKDSFKISKDKPSMGIVGKEVVFSTKEAMDFEDWSHGGPGRAEETGLMTRLVKLEVKFGLSTKMHYLVFPWLPTHPDMLIFDAKPFGVGLLKADGYTAFGKLYLEGSIPDSFIELPDLPDIVEVPYSRTNSDGIALTFPTGKSRLMDLTEKDRRLLREFVTNKARGIKALSESFAFTP